MCAFVLSNVYDKFNQSQSQSSKKKRNVGDAAGQVTEAISAKEKTAITAEVLRELRGALSSSEAALGKKFIED